MGSFQLQLKNFFPYIKLPRNKKKIEALEDAEKYSGVPRLVSNILKDKYNINDNLNFTLHIDHNFS